MGFFGRDTELKSLNNMYQSDKFEMVIIYGRRRVGKTALISEFIKDKRAIYYQARQVDRRDNLEGLTQAINRFKGQTSNTGGFSDFDAVFQEINELAQDEKLTFVIDEYPYLAESYAGVSSILQANIDHLLIDNPNLTLVLLGSSMSFMAKQVLGYQSPIYGRKTGQIHLQPFTIFEMQAILSEVSNEELVAYFGILGGVPHYLNMIDQKASIGENIERLFLQPAAPLLEETLTLLKEELRDPEKYASILKAIAGGASKPSEIIQKSGIVASSLGKYLENLIELGFVSKKLPVTEKPTSRKTLYQLDDQLFRFYYRFIDPETSLIALGLTDNLADEMVNRLPTYLGHTFEIVIFQWFVKGLQTHELKFAPKQLGSWWGSDPATKQQEELDFVAITRDNQTITAESKFRDSGLNNGMIDKLVYRTNLIGLPNQQMYFFTKDMSAEMRGYAQSKQVEVVDLATLLAK
ncbi:MAG: ATP-binding protein [Lactobacillaceae bacterium]|nr:ATP-binding protein [Lactobacillaceae bacterium]